MPTDMVIYEISNFKKKKQKLTKNVIHIITNKVCFYTYFLEKLIWRSQIN